MCISVLYILYTHKYKWIEVCVYIYILCIYIYCIYMYTIYIKSGKYLSEFCHYFCNFSVRL